MNKYEAFNSIQFQSSTNILKNINEKGVIIFGASGEMGSKITSTFARANVPVIMQDIDKDKLIESKSEALKTLEKAVSKRKLTKGQLESILNEKLIDTTVTFPERGKIPFNEINNEKKFVLDFLKKNIPDENEYKKYINSGMILEAGPEILSFKQDVFKFFEQLSDSSPVLATNTSSLKVDDIGIKVIDKKRVAGYHYFLPAHINPLIEIIAGENTPIELIQGLQNLAIAMGKKPIICWKDQAGAIANRILVGILNEAAKIYDNGLGSSEEIDKVFLEVFYSKQIKIQTKKAKKQFQAAPKLAFFKDESGLYKQIYKCEKAQDYLKKKNLLEIAEGRLRQKILYSQIVENLSSLGSFFKAAPCVGKLKTKAQEQMKNIRLYLNEVERNPEHIKNNIEITPYTFPKPEKEQSNNPAIIKARLKGAYIGIAQKIYNEGLGNIQDIELACKEGFKWNIGPFELINLIGTEESKKIASLVSKDLTNNTGIASVDELHPINPKELSGIMTYIQNEVGFIVLGRLHIQNFQMMQNSLSLQMLEAISSALKEFQDKRVKAIIIKNQGGGAFSSGADLEYIQSTNWDTEKILAYINYGKKTMKEISNSPIPITAIVDGPAVGGGLELALACDYRIMTDLCFVAMPEVALGIIPDWGGTEKLPAIIGKELAKRMICTATLNNMGLKLSAEDAKILGLADEYVLQHKLPEYINKLIKHETEIDIYKKSSQKSNYDRKDYPSHIVKRFELNKPFKHPFRWTTKYAARLAEDLINHSEDLSYSEKTNDDQSSIKLIKSGRQVTDRFINPMLFAIQNKLLATVLEKVGII